ncbi:MAG: YhdP family protein [Pseudomonadota bacterium]
MRNSLPIRLLWHSFNWLTRLTIVASAIFALLSAATILLMRYWLLPDIGQHHDKIVASLTKAVGNPVAIDKLEADWRGFRPRLKLTGVRLLGAQGQPALVLPKVEGSVSWMSLLFAELRLENLRIEQPELLIRRDTQRNIYIGGIALSTQAGDSRFADWLLHQSKMVVSDAVIIWFDELRDAPPLMLRQVDLRIESWLDHHQLALRAVPPEVLAMPFEVRGDFYGDSFDDLATWRGQLFTQLDYTDVVAWRPWIDLPQEFSRGRGGLRGWLSVANGEVGQLTADLDLHGVITRLADDVPEMALHTLRGRVAWKRSTDALEVSSKQLALSLRDGVSLPPTDVYFRTSNDRQGGGQIRANQLQLESLTNLAKFMPLPADLRQQLDDYAPRGRVSDFSLQWRGTSAQPDVFSIKGRFENMAIQQVGRLPGVSGLTVEVDGNDQEGRIKIDSRQLQLDAPEVMPESLAFTRLTGQAGWQRKNGELLINVDQLAVANDELAGDVRVRYQSKAGTPGMLDLDAKLTRGDIRYASRYVPLVALSKTGNDWLKGAIQGGQTADLRIRIQGDLGDFPLDGSEATLFEIKGDMRGGILEFDPAWPRIENIDGTLLIRGNQLQVTAPTATMLGANLQNVTVALPQMAGGDLILGVQGTALAASNTFLDFIQQSPVRGYIDEFTDGMSATGNATLTLDAQIPLTGEKPLELSGAVAVQGNDIDLGGGAPMLRKTAGTLSFTQQGMRARGIKSEILGGTAKIDLNTGVGGAVKATATGRSNFAVLRQLNPHPLLGYVQGGAAWRADVSAKQKSVQIVVTSNLQGMESVLPAPFAKRASTAMRLRFEKKTEGEGRDIVAVQLGTLLDAKFARSEEQGAMEIKRGLVNFGGQANLPGRDGLWVTGTLPELTLAGWGDLIHAVEDGGNRALPLTALSVAVGKVSGYGVNVDNLAITAGKSAGGYAAKLSSDTLRGDVEWQSRDTGKLTAKLDKLYWQHDLLEQNKNVEKATPIAPGTLPALQISVEDFKMSGKHIGHLDIVGHPDGRDWLLRRLNMSNPDGSLVGSGVWRGGQTLAQTELDLILKINDAGKILERSGYPNTVKNGGGRLDAKLSWLGQPDEFNYATLDGSLQLETGKGRFIKMEPGVGKLLSVLSLQALPKRITLDFNDVFSDGFQFDSIKGDAQIKHGVLTTQHFNISGSSAKVTMAGNVDLNTATQDLRIKVLPTLGDSVSLLSAFAAGPLVGVGALIANKVLGNPLDKLVSFEYNVSGTWDNPNVVKLGKSPTAPPASQQQQ